MYGFSDGEAAILTGVLNMAEPRWTSLDLANHLGTSQSAVARTWRKAYSMSPALPALPSAFSLTQVIYANGHGYFVAHIESGAPQRKTVDSNQLMRSPRRIPFQAMLAVQLLHTPSTKSVPTPDISSTDNSIIFTTDENYVSSNTHIQVIAPQDWQHLLLWLIQAGHMTSAGNLRQLHQSIAQWAQNPTTPFRWNAQSHFDKKAVTPNSVRSTPATVQQIVADQCFEWIVERIWNGELTAGDRVTETSLAKSLHTTRNQTRDALRSLASAGLLDHHPVRGVLVPAPTRADISDIYAARRPLGLEILNRAITNPQLDIDAIKRALGQVLEMAATGNSYETGNADMKFQDVIAQCSGMRNIPQMFGTLAKQIRIYIAVMGMSYLYSIDDMVSDDKTIFAAIVARDIEAASRAWNKKMDDVINYMTSKVTRARKAH